MKPSARGGLSATALEAILDLTHDAVALVDSDARVLHWNPAAEALYGYAAHEILDHSISVLDAGSGPLPAPKASLPERFEIFRRHRDGRLIDVAVARQLLPGSDGEPVWLDLSRDIHARKQSARNLRIQQAVAASLLESLSPGENIGRFLEAICRSLGWSVGEVWVVEPPIKAMRMIETWHSPVKELASFVEFGKHLLVPMGTSLPGRVWREGRLIWLGNLADDTQFVRVEAATRAGLRGAIGFPLRDQGEIVGVATFLSHSMPQPDDKLEALLVTLGAHLGQSIRFKQAIADHRQNEQNFRVIFETAPIGMALVDHLGAVLNCNSALTRFLGRPPCEHDGNLLVPNSLGYRLCRLQAGELFGMVHPDDRDEIALRFHELLEGDLPHFDAQPRYVLPDGSIAWARASATRLPVSGANPPLVLLMLEDITARKHAEDELARRKDALELANQDLKAQAERIEAEVIQRTRQLKTANRELRRHASELALERNFMEGMIQHLPGTLMYLDTRMVIRRISPEFTRRFELGAGELLGRSLAELSEDLAASIVRDLRGALLPELRRILETHAPTEVRDVPLSMTVQERPNAYFDFSLTPVFDNEGEVTGLLVLGVDVTDRVRYQRLQREQIETLRQSDTLKTQFINTLSHEFKTPLTIVTGAAELLSEGVIGPVSPAQKDYLAKIRGAAKTLLHLVSDLLDMSQIQAGKLTLVRKPMSLPETLENALHLLTPLLDRKKLRLQREIPPGIPEIHADEQRLTQVLLNLLGNAIKFTPDGGEIRVTLSDAPGHVVCSIRDNGVGIAPEDLPKLFEAFVQLEAGQQAGGTGLGLGICKALIEAHGGEIGVESEGAAGNGSHFWFRLPKAREASAPD
jgi:PAS domain S-box-containing protein